MIWYLPHSQAIAKARPGSRIDVICKPGSRGDQLYGADPHFDRVLFIERRRARARPDQFKGPVARLKQERRGGRHDGWSGFWSLVREWRAQNYTEIFIFHRSWRYALIAWLAGIPRRHGYGRGIQRLWLSWRETAFLPQQAWAHPAWHQIRLATGFTHAQGIALPTLQPRLVLPQDRLQVMRQQLPVNTPLIALGIGSSAEFKQWGAQKFAQLARELLDAESSAHLVLVGGGEAKAIADVIVSAVRHACKSHIHILLDATVTDIACGLSYCDYYVGNDSGFLNVACSVGIPTYGIFGGTRALRYSALIKPISSPDIRYDRHSESMNGMQHISVQHVLADLPTFNHTP